MKWMAFCLVSVLAFLCVVFFSLLGVFLMNDKKNDMGKKPKKACKLCGCMVPLNKERICLECFNWRKKGEQSRG